MEPHAWTHFRWTTPDAISSYIYFLTALLAMWQSSSRARLHEWMAREHFGHSTTHGWLMMVPRCFGMFALLRCVHFILRDMTRTSECEPSGYGSQGAFRVIGRTAHHMDSLHVGLLATCNRVATLLYYTAMSCVLLYWAEIIGLLTLPTLAGPRCSVL